MKYSIVIVFALFILVGCGPKSPAFINRPQDEIPKPAEKKECVVTGCSGQVCADGERTTTCEYREQFACYKSATCERQANGTCGWTQTDQLSLCLKKAGVEPDDVTALY